MTPVQEALQLLTKEQIEKGLRAYDMPRWMMDGGTCFVDQVFHIETDEPGMLTGFMRGETLIGHAPRAALSEAYEIDRSSKLDIFRSECIRELAERPTPSIPVASPH